jgi:hypothetical protein
MGRADAPLLSRAWNTRFFEALPFAPAWVGLALAASLLALLVAASLASGDLAALTADGRPWWRVRDGRLAVLLCLFAGFLPTALRYHELGTLSCLAELGSVLGWAPADLAAARREFDEGATPLRAGAIGLLLVPVVLLIVDRDPSLYLEAGYWRAINLWTWGLGGFAAYLLGVLTYRVERDGRRFSALGRDLPEIDLLDVGSLTPFARQGLRASLFSIAPLSLFAFNLVDAAFLPVVLLIALVSLPLAAVALLRPVYGIHDRIVREKRAELARVNAAIRGDLAALRGSAIGAGPAAGLADLLAYRSFVASLPDWPFDTRIRARIVLTLAIPIGSWIGGALVERAFDLALG